jgi:hypothetical protein
MITTRPLVCAAALVALHFASPHPDGAALLAGAAIIVALAPRRAPKP